MQIMPYSTYTHRRGHKYDWILTMSNYIQYTVILISHKHVNSIRRHDDKDSLVAISIILSYSLNLYGN